MKKAVWLAGMFTVSCLLTGCHKFSPDVTGISISSKNVITQVIKESFDNESYSREELASQIQSEISEYNGKTKSIKSSGLKVKDGMAELELTYVNPEAYAQFNNEAFYVGDMYDAIQNGYTFQGSFNRVSKGKVEEEGIWGSSIMIGDTNYKAVVISEAMLVRVPGKICYVSSNLTVTGSSEAVLEADELAYILYE